MKLLCFADLHLGAGASLGREPGDRLADQSRVLEQIFRRALDREAEAVLIAGDIFEGPTVTPEQMDMFADFVDACYGRGIPIVAISGNGVHDQAMRTVNGLAIFDRLPGITVYSYPTLHDLGTVQVACLPWVSPARLIAAANGNIQRDHVNAAAAELIIKAASEIADPRVKPTVLLMHGSISGASLPTGISTDDLREPVVSLDALLGLGYAAVVVGHIHKSQIVGPAGKWVAPDEIDAVAILSAPPIVLYTGSPMALNFGETGVPHGAWLIDVKEQGSGAEFVPVESRPLVQVKLEADENGSVWPMRIAPGSLAGAIVKVTVALTESQRRHFDVAALRANFLTEGAHTVKIDVVAIREDRARVEHVTDELGPLEAFDAWAAANEAMGTLVPAAREQMQADLEQVPA